MRETSVADWGEARQGRGGSQQMVNDWSWVPEGTLGNDGDLMPQNYPCWGTRDLTSLSHGWKLLPFPSSSLWVGSVTFGENLQERDGNATSRSQPVCSAGVRPKKFGQAVVESGNPCFVSSWKTLGASCSLELPYSLPSESKDFLFSFSSVVPKSSVQSLNVKVPP